MAELALEEIDGDLYLKVTPRRARALSEALNIVLRSGSLDKSTKGIITVHCKLFEEVASDQFEERNPARWVYIVKDIGEHGEELTKIGHARDLVQRFSRMTDRPTRLKPKAAWRFSTVAEAMEREHSARQKYDPYKGDGGREWVKARVDSVLVDLREAWGKPDFLDQQ